MPEEAESADELEPDKAAAEDVPCLECGCGMITLALTAPGGVPAAGRAHTEREMCLA